MLAYPVQRKAPMTRLRMAVKALGWLPVRAFW